MKKSIVVVLGVAAAVLLVVTIVLSVKYKQTSNRYAETRSAEEAVRGQFNSALESIAEIQDSLNAIVPTEDKLVRLSQNAEMGSSVTQTQKEQMLGTVADLRQSIDNSKKRIKQLEKDLKSSRTEVAGLRRIIDNLKRSVADKEVTIRRLTAKVDSLSTTVAGLQTDVARGQEKIVEQQGVIEQKQGVIEEKQKELGAIYYIIGTKKDLKAKGIVVDKGGVIGLGKSTLVSGTFDESDFTLLDTDTTTEIPIQGKEPQVLSAQTKASYEIQTTEGASTLVIKDAREFRKVKYLVILVK